MLAMFSSRTTLLAPVLVLLALVMRVTAYYPQGFITVPANGTAITPGEPFDFKFNTRGDYCVSSYNFTVYLFTQVPSPNMFFIGEENQFASGLYIGRYRQATSGTPVATNPPPAQLVAPDFSQSLGGFGSGKSLTNETVYLTVISEWSQCGSYPGVRFSLTYNTLQYNATQAE